MSMALEQHWRTVKLTTPVVVELLAWIGVGGWGRPSISRIVQMPVASFAFTNNAPILASAVADAMTLQSMMEVVWRGPLAVRNWLGG